MLLELVFVVDELELVLEVPVLVVVVVLVVVLVVTRILSSTTASSGLTIVTSTASNTCVHSLKRSGDACSSLVNCNASS